MSNKHKDKRSYNKNKVILYFIMEIISLLLIASILVYVLPKWIVVILIVILMMNPYERYVKKVNDIKSKRKCYE